MMQTLGLKLGLASLSVMYIHEPEGTCMCHKLSRTGWGNNFPELAGKIVIVQ